MAYPLSEMPTFKDFINECKSKYGCEISGVEMKDNMGQKAVVTRIIRRNGDMGRATIEMKPNERFTPGNLRSICRRLNIDPRGFGLHLDGE